MTKMNRRSLLALLGTVPLAGLAVQGQTTDTDKKRKFKEIPSRERIRQRYFPNLEFTNQFGKKVMLYDDLIKDKIVMINMFYAKCNGVCVPITKNLVKVQQLLGDRVGRDIFMLSFTLNPEEDTPEHLAHYSQMHRIRPGWSLLTGTPGNIETLRRKLGFTDPDPVVDKERSNHIGVVKYGNEPFERWGGCPAMSKPSWMVKTLSWVDMPKSERV